MSDEDIWRLNRGGHDPHQGLRRLRGGSEAQGPAHGDPGQDRQGLRHGQGRRRPEHHPPAEEDGRRTDLQAPSATASTSRSRTTRSRSCPSTARRRQPGNEIPAQRRAALGGYGAGPRTKAAARWRGAAAGGFQAATGGTGDREISTTMAFVRILTAHCCGQDPRQAYRAHRSGRGPHLRHGRPVPPDRHLLLRRASSTSRWTPTRSCTTGRTRRARSWRRASTRPAPSRPGSPPPRPTANHGVNMIPFYIYYSMFGFQRIGDLAWAAGDSGPGASCSAPPPAARR
jgi:pyruvate dehydrogenase E1 component